MKIIGKKEEIIPVCKDITDIKQDNKQEIKKSGIKQKATKGLVNTVTSLSGGISLDDAFESLVINYYEDGDDVILHMPFYIPSGVRFLFKRKIIKAFKEIFNKSCEHKVNVKFLSWD